MSSAGGTTVLVLAKAPLAGYSKTRLIPGYGPDGAADLAAAALADTLDAVLRADVADRVLVLDGSPDTLPNTLLGKGFRVVPQCDGSHADRIIAGFESVRDGAAVLIGMDTPQLDPAVLALDLTAPVDAWLGQAEDGGWWALGLRHPRRDAARVIHGVPMSTGRTGVVQRERLTAVGLGVADLPVLRDVDEVADAIAVAGSAPGSRFARCLTGLHAAAVGG